LNLIDKKFISAITLTMALALSGAHASGDSIAYAGTATLCYIGAQAPLVEVSEEDGEKRVSGLVSLYYIQTAPSRAEPPGGLVNGWEVLTSDMKISGEAYTLEWTGVLAPTAYIGMAGTVLKETATVKTRDLSTLSGTWHGSGDLEGTLVDYVLKMIPGAEAKCPDEYPPQCKDMTGGCLPAEAPQVENPVVYDMSGFVR
jgi:hypothetical protein